MTPDQEAKAKFEKARYDAWIVFLHLLCIGILGLAFMPMVGLIYGAWKAAAPFGVPAKIAAFSFSLAFGYFLFGAILIILCVAVKNLLGFKIQPGLFPHHSTPVLRWLGYNSMILLVNSAFLDVLRLSPFQTLFYRLMGAQVGENVSINTGGLADLAMLEIGDNVIVGGGTALICHGAERGLLRLSPTKIGKNVSIGLNCVVMPGCIIGDGASIGPCSYLPKGTEIPPRGSWGGNPIRDLRAERREERARLQTDRPEEPSV